MRSPPRFLFFAWVAAALALGCGTDREAASGPPDAGGGSVHGALPESIDAASRYLIYLHGKIIEDEGLRPESPRFGIYEYEAILDAFAERGFVVISEARERGASAEAYARRVVEQVETLLGEGVPPGRITVVGFSKGGGIAILASSMLGDTGVNFVFLAICGDWLSGPHGVQDVGGRILSIYEAGDEFGGSCRALLEGATRVPEWEEIELRLGGGHGVFYRPRPEWIDPVAAWASGREP